MFPTPPGKLDDKVLLFPKVFDIFSYNNTMLAIIFPYFFSGTDFPKPVFSAFPLTFSVFSGIFTTFC